MNSVGLMELPDGWDLQRIRAIDASADLIDSALHRIIDVTPVDWPREMRAELVLSIDNKYLLLTADEADWWMGQLDKATGEIHCWGTYGPDLGEAIKAL
jgi:hypothetical protein